ncbi:hypothetical protein [Saccharothrix deserti]|uniref:hypothetical protein n=1 Tax=Saccharothrix deserti TaxID=2593674 RepID=UPI00131D2893|nr:hypothetical protein [Saccharothrix deserti]
MAGQRVGAAAGGQPAHEVRARLGATEVEVVDERTCRLRLTDTVEYLAFHLVQLGCEFEVHEPREVLEHLREVHGRIGRAIDG